MKRKLLGGLLLWLGLVVPILAQHLGNAGTQHRPYFAGNQADSPTEGFVNDSTLVVVARVLINVPARSYLAVFSLTQVGESLDEAQKLLARRLQQFGKSLAELGVAPTDLHTDLVSQIPVYEVEIEKRLFSKTYTEVPRGFQVQKNLHIAYRDDALLEKILTEAAKAEIYDLAEVRYLVANPQAVGDTLRQVAAAVLAKKTQAYRTLGLRLDAKYQTVADQLTVYQPADRYADYTAYSANQITPRRGAVVNEADKPTTHYYKPLPPETFDWAGNPYPLAPVVQFVYVVKVKYVLKKG
jgi:uncharacterized protein YggE